MTASFINFVVDLCILKVIRKYAFIAAIEDNKKQVNVTLLGGK